MNKYNDTDKTIGKRYSSYSIFQDTYIKLIKNLIHIDLVPCEDLM